MMPVRVMCFGLIVVVLLVVALGWMFFADAPKASVQRRVSFAILNRSDHRLLDSQLYYENGEIAASFGEILSGTGSGRYSSLKATVLPERILSIWRSPGFGEIRNEIQVPRIPAGLLQDYNDADILLIVLGDNNVLAQWRLTDSPSFGSPPRLVKDSVYWPSYDSIFAIRLR